MNKKELASYSYSAGMLTVALIFLVATTIKTIIEGNYMLSIFLLLALIFFSYNTYNVLKEIKVEVNKK